MSEQTDLPAQAFRPSRAFLGLALIALGLSGLVTATTSVDIAPWAMPTVIAAAACLSLGASTVRQLLRQ